MREAGQVTDKRPDRRTAPAPRRQHVSHGSGTTYLVRDLTRELEHLPVQQEEAGQPELLDQHELFLESLANAFLVAVQFRVALDEGVLADTAQLHDRRFHPVGEVGIAVAELLCPIELPAL